MKQEKEKARAEKLEAKSLGRKHEMMPTHSSRQVFTLLPQEGDSEAVRLYKEKKREYWKEAVQDPVIPIIGQLVRDRPDCISLGQGVVPYAPPECVATAVAAAATETESSGVHRYAGVMGNTDLTDAIVQKLQRDNAIRFDRSTQSICVTAGSNMAFLAAAMAIADPGDEFLLMCPFYFNHEMAIRMIDCVPVFVPTLAPDFQLNLPAIRKAITPRTRAIVTISPNNPTGAVYAGVMGNTDLTDAIVQKLQRDNAIRFDRSTQSICVTAGSNMAFLAAAMAIADPGDEFLLMCPFYFNHEMAIRMIDCVPVFVPTLAPDFQLNLPAIRKAITPRTRAIVTISPNNPTGAVYSPEALIEVNKLCAEQTRTGVYHICDEAYEYFTYTATQSLPFVTASLGEATRAHTISLFSLSKSFGMAGWRIGYMLMPKHLESAVEKIQDTNLICPPPVCQVAARAALLEASGPEGPVSGGAWVREKTKHYDSVRQEVLSTLRAQCENEGLKGVSVPEPMGAFYVMISTERLSVEKLSKASEAILPLPLITGRQVEDAFVRALIRDFGVAALPGSTFGVEPTETGGLSLRLAYGVLTDDAKRRGMAIRRLIDALKFFILD
uniref:Aminotransferase class I/classII large domain-containing protein n=1 Tax=Chromera velia CCMP2878 TaxID=1169474 RepID=A0A0G4I1L9_9ALVE|eukprot:Cvel_10193.t1-p1 / transcript=Cvel_10193.t1 / gene=Cvel_10193 / organism=Chromera_velia_CCMP2878 / gene_product=Aspartate aminotransferase, putative / transcript_product=Aspartate aminotransferase, putative / location=Cvel_scaffold609:47298-53658(+) / protein_length=609 / sequence_SO=supercontig / SO=protein_coding / is_pseudo=false